MLRLAIPVIASIAVSAALAFCTPQETKPAGRFDELLHRGFDLHQKSEYQRAIPILRSAWKLRPREYFVNLLLGIDLLRTGQAIDCLPFLHVAAQQKPNEEFAYEYIGEAHASLRQDAEAYQAFLKATQIAPESPEAAASFVGFCLTRFADLAGQMRSTKEGLAAEYRLQASGRPVTDPSRIELLERAASLSNDAESWALLAYGQIAVGELSAAREALEQAKAWNAEALTTRQAQALLAGKEGNWAEAGAQLNAIGERSPSTLARLLAGWPTEIRPPDGSVITGAVQPILDCLKAVCDAKGILARVPSVRVPEKTSLAALYREQRWEALASSGAPVKGQPEALQHYGVALAEIGDCERAVPVLEESLQQKVQPVVTAFELSRCYAQLADRVAARQSQGNENQAVVHLMRGDVLFRLQADSKGALAEYSAAVRAQPKDPAAWERLGEAQLSAGSPDEAKRSANKALELDPHRTPAIRTLAQAAMEERNYSEALPYLRELRKKNPRDLAVRTQLAIAYSQTGALEEALANLAPALEQGYPDEKGSLHYQLGTILRRLGRAEEANKAFATAKALSDRFQRTSLREKDSKE